MTIRAGSREAFELISGPLLISIFCVTVCLRILSASFCLQHDSNVFDAAWPFVARSGSLEARSRPAGPSSSQKLQNGQGFPRHLLTFLIVVVKLSRNIADRGGVCWKPVKISRPAMQQTGLVTPRAVRKVRAPAARPNACHRRIALGPIHRNPVVCRAFRSRHGPRRCRSSATATRRSPRGQFSTTPTGLVPMVLHARCAGYAPSTWQYCVVSLGSGVPWGLFSHIGHLRCPCNLL